MKKSKIMGILVILILISATMACTYNRKGSSSTYNGNVSSDTYYNKVYEYNEDINYSIYTSSFIDTYLIACALYGDFTSNIILPDSNEHEIYIKAKEHFLPYKNHEFIKGLGRYINDDDIHEDVVTALLAYTSYKSPEEAYNLNANGVNHIFANEEEIKEFIKELEKFYTDSKAEEFFKENSQIYKNLNVYINDNVNSTRIIDLIKESEKYVGNKEILYKGENIRYETFMTVFRPFIASFYEIKGKDETLIVSFQSPNDYFRNPEVFDISQSISSTIHEFLHCFVNVPVEKNKAFIEELASGKRTVDYASPMYQYMPWNRIVDENFVRAIQGRIYANVFDENKAWDEVLDKEIRFGGFTRLEDICNKLE